MRSLRPPHPYILQANTQTARRAQPCWSWRLTSHLCTVPQTGVKLGSVQPATDTHLASNGAKSPLPGLDSHHNEFGPATVTKGNQRLSCPGWWW